MPTYSHVGHSRPTDEGLERLRRDLENVVPLESDDESEPVNYAALEFELERLMRRLAIWQIFMTHLEDGAQSWPEIQGSLTPRELDDILEICDGASLRDLLLDEG